MLATQPHWTCGAAANFGLPQRVEAFDGVLHPVLEWRHEYGRHAELQAHAADATWSGTGEWVDSTNWTPSTVPDGTATFTNTGATTVANDNGDVVAGFARSGRAFC